MAENSTRTEIRKLRKKLRQIEHLERLERDLTQEEYEKVSKKSDIRRLLNDKLVKLEKEDENIEAINSMMAKNCSNKGITADVNELEQQVPASMSSEASNIKSLPKKSVSEDAECSTSAIERDISHTGNSSYVKNDTSAVNDSYVDDQVSSAVVPSVGIPSSASTSSTTSTSSMKKAAKKQSTAGVSGSYQWQDKKFTIKCLEGHNDQIFSVDMDGSLLISGSRDTMLKVWDCESGKEVRSMGGHTGGITSVVLIKKDENEREASISASLGVTGSHDCSIRIWSLGDDNTLRSIYAYSPVLCLDRRKGNLVSGSESGKVELWDLEASENICSTRGNDDAVSCVKFKCEQIVSGSSAGTVKIWDTRQRSLMPAITSDSFMTPFAKKRKVHCLATTENSVYWGDDGTNIKVLDIRVGKVRKLKNHLTEFGTTSAMIVHDSFLISSGYDLDKGTGYLNVRTLPDEEYAATLDDDVTSYISCLCCTDVRKECGVVCPRLCTGGSELKIWDQLSTNKVQKRTRTDEDPSFITSKHFRRYSGGDPIDTESSDESDDEGRRDDSSDEDEENDGATSNARQSWCTIS